MRYRSIYLTVIYLVSSLAASGQYYDTGQDPANLKWLQIKTDRFTVIYPEKYGQKGIEFTQSLERSYSKLNSLFPERKFRIPVIIHNYTIRSNGYVAWAPKRMEIYPTPEQNTIPLDENTQLTLHELTHVMQMESLNTGFSKAMSYVLGQQFPGAVASLLPLWFMEGDAVFAESVLSESGRGRTSSFQKQLKAVVIENDHIYKFDKMLNGSFRDFTPDHYQFGYQMVAWSLVENDLQLWNRAMKFTANQPFTINPVNISLRRDAGLTKKRLFTQTFDSLRALWKEELLRSNSVIYNPVNPSKKRNFVNYYSPLFAGQDSIIAIKTSLSEPPVFVIIRPSDKSEKKLFTPGSIYPFFFSLGAGNIVWVETHPDPRWENREYSVIKLKNLKSGGVRQLTKKSRFLSASISPDGRLIAAAENTPEDKNSLAIISPSDGRVLERIPSPGNASLQRPQWSDNGNFITVINLTEEGEGILSYNFMGKVWKTLVEPGREDLQSTFLKNDSLFYVSSESGTENIFLLTPDNKKTTVTRSRFGATDLCVSRSSVLFSDYSASGNNICMTSLSKNEGVTFSTVKPVSFLVDRIDLPKNKGEENSNGNYRPQPYKKWQHLLGIHSWMPLYADIEAIQSDPASVRPGITVLSQNQLSTLIASAGYEYSADKRHLLHSRVAWNGWYPVIESRIDYGYAPVIDKVGETVPWTPSNPNPLTKFTNTVSVPLLFSPGSFSQTFYPSFSIDYWNRYIYLKKSDTYDYGQFQMTGRLYFANYYRFAYRDINTRWAQVFDLSYTFAPFDKLIYGNDLALKTIFYFPGFLPNNSIRIRYETEKQKFEKFYSSNRIHYPRSYLNIISTKLDFVSVDYSMPLFYPDLNISSLLYIKRIRSGLFYDYAEGIDNYHFDTKTRNPKTERFSSFGLELLSDFYILRIPYMMSAGVQAAWREPGTAPAFEFLFNIDIYGMSIGRRRF